MSAPVEVTVGVVSINSQSHTYSTSSPSNILVVVENESRNVAHAQTTFILYLFVRGGGDRFQDQDRTTLPCLHSAAFHKVEQFSAFVTVYTV